MRAVRAVVAVLVALAVTPATAGAVSGVSISPAGGFGLSGELRFVNGAASMECRYTLEGRFFAGTIPVTGPEAQVGEITGLTWSECEGGSVSGVLTMPWPITLDSLDGLDPTLAPARALTEAVLRIDGIGLMLNGFAGFGNCLYGGGTGFDAIDLLTAAPYNPSVFAVSGLVRYTPARCPQFFEPEGLLELAPAQRFTYLP